MAVPLMGQWTLAKGSEIGDVEQRGVQFVHGLEQRLARWAGGGGFHYRFRGWFHGGVFLRLGSAYGLRLGIFGSGLGLIFLRLGLCGFLAFGGDGRFLVLFRGLVGFVGHRGGSARLPLARAGFPLFIRDRNDGVPSRSPRRRHDRLDRYLAAELPHLSRSRLQTLIKNGHVTLNGKPARPGDKVRAGAAVTVTEPPAEPSLLEPEDIPLDILYEDDDLLVLNKPPGLVVHPAAGHARHTLVNALLAHCQSLSGIGGEQRPGIVHRLDKDTSGCLVVAKNDLAHAHLSRQFAGRTVTKIYLALAQGYFAGQRSGSIDNADRPPHPVDRKKMAVLPSPRPCGRASRTSWRVVQAELPRASAPWWSARCTPGARIKSVCTSSICGHPLLGDALYAPRMAGHYARQMLHAWRLGFTHPRTGQPMHFSSPLPEDFVLAGVRIPEE